MTNKAVQISVLGAGSWGITLANLAAKRGHFVKLWEYDPRVAQVLIKQRVRESVLPDVSIRVDIEIIHDLERALHGANIVLFAIPSHVARAVMKQIAQIKGRSEVVLTSCTKGIENQTHLRVSQVFEQEIKTDRYKFCVLSGPSHAEEVSREIPTAIVAASVIPGLAEYVQDMLTTPFFRIYTSQDVIGVELGGALKNVIAIAAGICDGAGFGDNTKAALQPRGLAEIVRLGRKFNANPMTFSGLSGMGDLIVTCMSKHSRNRFLGEQIGKGRTLSEVLSQMTMVAEGVRTCKSAVALGEIHGVDLPICTQVFQVLFHMKNPTDAMKELMTRELKPELWH